MEKLGFSLQERYSLPMSQVIDLLADTGFCAVSLTWDRSGDNESVVRHASWPRAWNARHVESRFGNCPPSSAGSFAGGYGLRKNGDPDPGDPPLERRELYV